MVMEVSLDKSRTLGASFHGGIPNVPIFGKQSLVLGGLDITKTLNPGGLLTGGGGHADGSADRDERDDDVSTSDHFRCPDSPA